MGLQPVWNLSTLGASPDPMREFPGLIHAARLHSRILVMLVILSAGLLVYTMTRAVAAGAFAVTLLSGSSGLLFHGLLTRPELLCVCFGNLLALLCTCRALRSRSLGRNHLWLFAAGICVGCAALEKLPGMTYLALCAAWCWAATLPGEAGDVAPALPDCPRNLASAWLPALASLAVLALLHHLQVVYKDLDGVAVLRVRVAAVIVALLPLLTLTEGRNRVGAFLLRRNREVALLGAGFLSALPLAYLAVRLVMDDAAASSYLARVTSLVFNPGPYMKIFLAVRPQVTHEFLRFLRETPFLFAGTTVLVVGIGLMRPPPLRLKAAMALLLLAAFGIVLVMCRRQFTAQYSVFPQVPLLMVWALALDAVTPRWRGGQAGANLPWAAPVALVAASALAATAYFRVEPKYTGYQDDARLPVTEFVVTFLYDHDVHPKAYRQVMREHYPSREDFRMRLDRYLADPANRY
jgi:hypothetical protein